MRFKKIKIGLLSLVVMLVASCWSLNSFVNAKSGSTVDDNYDNKSSSEVLSKEIYVSDIFELVQAVNNISPWGKIFLKNDINMLGITLRVKKSLVIDLNGHSILVDQNSGGIVIESKYSIDRKKIIKEYSSDYVWSDKDHKIKKPFFGGEGYKLTVVDYEDSDEYNDDIYVTMQNGSVTHESGRDGRNGEPCTWLKCSGGNGETPIAPININSGVLSLVNMSVTGGNGGQGGNGAHYPFAHLPFSGGCGADGGNGGNGGSAISILRREVRFIVDKNTKVSSGIPGKGGKGGEPSNDYWFYRSKPGVAGKSGGKKPDIEYKYKNRKST